MNSKNLIKKIYSATIVGAACVVFALIMVVPFSLFDGVKHRDLEGLLAMVGYYSIAYSIFKWARPKVMKWVDDSNFMKL